MADEMSFDFSELDQLAADLGQVADNAGPLINSAVQVTSVKVKKAAAKTVRGGSKRWKALPSTIDYDVTVFQGFGVSVIKSEIGYNKGKGGSLGNVREFGAPQQSTPPSNDLLNALEANQGDFQKGLEIALRDAERRAGL
jgi:hypothetical protein